MARLHWLIPVACVLLSWLNVAADVFAVTQYAALAKQRRTEAWRCSNAPVVTGWSSSLAAAQQQQRRHRNPFTTPACARLALTSSSSPTGPSLIFRNPPYSFAFWMCVYLTVGLLAAHLLCQAAIAMWAVREARRAGFGDECDNCGPILPYITAAARGLVLCEPAYQSLCAYAPVAGMTAGEQELYTRHAQKVFIRSRLAELVLKGPCVTVAAFALLLQLIALSSSSQLYTPPGAFSSSRSVATLPLVVTALSFGVGVLSLAVFCGAYAVSQRQSLWGGAKLTQTRGFAKTAVYASATGIYCACSAVCRAVAIAASLASVMLDDNIGRASFYLVVAGLVALLVIGWMLYSNCCVCGGRGMSLDCMSCVRGAYCSFVSSFIVSMPWNTSAAIYSHDSNRSTGGGTASGDGSSGGGFAGGGMFRWRRSSESSSRIPRERRWWPAIVFSVISAVALLATALLLALLVGSQGTCYAVCGGYVTAQGLPQGYVFFSVPAGLLVAVLVVAEVLLFVLLSRTAPKRKFDDDWDDEFIELDPHAGKVPI